MHSWTYNFSVTDFLKPKYFKTIASQNLAFQILYKNAQKYKSFDLFNTVYSVIEKVFQSIEFESKLFLIYKWWKHEKLYFRFYMLLF